MIHALTYPSRIKVIRRHQQLQTQLRGDIHVRHVGLVFVLLVVAEILAHLFENDAADVFQDAAACQCFGEFA